MSLLSKNRENTSFHSVYFSIMQYFVNQIAFRNWPALLGFLVISEVQKNMGERCMKPFAKGEPDTVYPDTVAKLALCGLGTFFHVSRSSENMWSMESTGPLHSLK